ncbi:MAG: sortase [Clostridia bacterium]|nr:sortase [Clostridia bacterium]
MRIIYEDGNYREERERNEAAKKEDFVDISSMSADYKKSIDAESSRPRRPVPSLRVETAQPTAPQTEQPESEAQPVAAPPQGYAPQPMYYPYPQGYPVQYPPVYPYTAGYPVAGQPVPPMAQYPVQMPYPQSPVTAQPPVISTPDSGTRVIYQSPDFDSQEPRAQSPAIYPAVQPVVRGSFTQEEVFIPLSGKTKSPSAKNRFAVDEMEMSVFELNSMAHKYQARSRAYSKQDASLEIEEFERAFEEDSVETQNEAETVAEEKSVKNKGGKKKSKKKKKDTARKTVLAISILAIIVSSGYLINEWRMSDQNEQEAKDAQQLIIDDSFDITPEAPSDDKSEDNGNDEPDVGENEPQVQQMTVEEKWAEIRKEYPKVDFPSEMQLKYAKLYATNSDFVGYLSAEGVGMDLPIVQGDDDETYLKKSFFGKNTKYGCPFVTHTNNITVDRNGLDMNTVIFGHHMKDGSVFGVLDEYKSIEGFKAAPVITFNTLYNDYQWKIIGVFLTNAYEKDDNGYVFKYYFTNLSSQERFSAYLNAVNERTLYYTGVDVLPTDKILTLSTCSYEFTDARFVVVARLVRQGESAEVDVSKAYKNDNPRYPQAYYDKKKQDNPYKDAYRWEVG